MHILLILLAVGGCFYAVVNNAPGARKTLLWGCIVVAGLFVLALAGEWHRDYVGSKYAARDADFRARCPLCGPPPRD